MALAEPVYPEPEFVGFGAAVRDSASQETQVAELLAEDVERVGTG